MSLNFFNASPNTVWVAILYYNPNGCDAASQYFSKAGWYQVDSGMTITPNVAPLLGNLQNGNARAYFFAQQYPGSTGEVWQGNIMVKVPDAVGFSQCLADKSSCDQWVGFNDIEFQGQPTVIVTLGPQAGQFSTPALPGQLDWDSGYITFSNGVAVGGYSHLTLFVDGTYMFTGHFHDSGSAEYNMSLVWAVVNSQNNAYTFTTSGHVAGTFESGSRDYNWSNNAQNDLIKQNWASIVAGNYAVWQAKAGGDLTNLVNSIISAISAAEAVIEDVIEIV